MYSLIRKNICTGQMKANNDNHLPSSYLNFSIAIQNVISCIILCHAQITTHFIMLEHEHNAFKAEEQYADSLSITIHNI